MPHRPGHLRTPRERAQTELFDAVLGVLRKHDFVHIGYVPDEYVPEVETILPRLSSARGVADVRRILYEEFVHWFSAEDVGPEERFESAAKEVWSIWSHRH
jgi:hypothetical protein